MNEEELTLNEKLKEFNDNDFVAGSKERLIKIINDFESGDIYLATVWFIKKNKPGKAEHLLEKHNISDELAASVYDTIRQRFQNKILERWNAAYKEKEWRKK